MLSSSPPSPRAGCTPIPFDEHHVDRDRHGAVCAGASATPGPLAGLPADVRRLAAFVIEAAAHARSNGRETALAAFNDRDGGVVRDDLYVFAIDLNGNRAGPDVPAGGRGNEPLRARRIRLGEGRARVSYSQTVSA